MKALKSLPSGLEQTYEAALKRIQRQVPPDLALAMRVLQWLSHARRPLLVDELRQALAVEWDDDEEPPRHLDLDNIQESASLVDVCAGLVTIEDESNIIRLVHLTTQEFFVKSRDVRFPDATTELSRTCLAYLSFTEFGEGFCNSDEGLESRLRQYPFLRYATHHWGYHLRGKPEQDLEDLAFVLLKDDASLSTSNQVMYLPDFHQPDYSQNFPRALKGLHVTAAFGMDRLSSALIQQRFEVEEKDSLGRSPMHYAAAGGHETVVRVLVANKADIETTDILGCTPLHRAAENARTGVAQLLLNQNAIVDAEDNEGETALHQASKWGHEAMVRLLLENHAKVGEQNEWEWTPLHYAAETGHRETARILIRGGAKVSTRDWEGWTPLHRAAARGQAAVLELLLESGAEVDERSFDYDKSALIWAAEIGRPEIIRILLCHGANISLQDCSGETGLHYASQSGNLAAVRVLLDHNAPLEVRNIHGHTPLDNAEHQGVVRAILMNLIQRKTPPGSEGSALRLAVLRGDYAMLQGILDSPQEFSPIEAPNDDTPLHLAAMEGHRELARLLIAKGFDVNARGNGEGTPLHRAATLGHTSVVQLLLEKGADVNAKTGLGSTAFDYAALNGHLAVIRLLLQTKQVNINAFNDGSTPLLRAANYGHSAVVRLLIEEGANVEDEHEVHCKTPIAGAAHHGHVDAVRVLLDANAVVNAQDRYGKTALHYAAYDGYEEVVQLLLDRQANKHLRDVAGQTPFGLAEQKGHRQIMKLLA